MSTSSAVAESANNYIYVPPATEFVSKAKAEYSFQVYNLVQDYFDKSHIKVQEYTIRTLTKANFGRKIKFYYPEKAETLEADLWNYMSEYFAEIEKLLEQDEYTVDQALIVALKFYVEEINKRFSAKDWSGADQMTHIHIQLLESAIECAKAGIALECRQAAYLRNILQTETKKIDKAIQDIENANDLATQDYMQAMQSYINQTNNPINELELEENHNNEEQNATITLQLAYAKIKVNSSTAIIIYEIGLKKLKLRIESLYANYTTENNNKWKKLKVLANEFLLIAKEAYCTKVKLLMEDGLTERVIAMGEAEIRNEINDQLIEKIHPNFTKPEFLKNTIGDLKTYMDTCFERFQKQLEEGKLVVEQALIIAEKFYKKEMNKRFSAKDWSGMDQLMTFNIELFEAAVTNATTAIKIYRCHEAYLKKAIKNEIAKIDKAIFDIENANDMAKRRYMLAMQSYTNQSNNPLNEVRLEEHHENEKQNATKRLELFYANLDGNGSIGIGMKKFKSDIENLYAKYKLENNKKWKHFETSAKEFLLNAKADYGSKVKSLVQNGLNETAIEEREAEIRREIEVQLIEKINPELAKPEFLKNVADDLKHYMIDSFTRFQAQLEQGKVAAALEVATKFYKNEMNKHLTGKDWPTADELTHINIRSTDNAVSTAKAVVKIDQRQENRLRDSMKPFYLQYIKEFEENWLRMRVYDAKSEYVSNVDKLVHHCFDTEIIKTREKKLRKLTEEKLVKQINFMGSKTVKFETNCLRNCMDEYYSEIKKQLEGDELAVKEALIISTKFCIEEMNKHFGAEDWAGTDQMTNMNVQLIEAAINTAKEAIKIERRQEMVLRKMIEADVTKICRRICDIENANKVAKGHYVQAMQSYINQTNNNNPISEAKLLDHHKNEKQNVTQRLKTQYKNIEKNGSTDVIFELGLEKFYSDIENVFVEYTSKNNTKWKEFEASADAFLCEAKEEYMLKVGKLVQDCFIERVIIEREAEISSKIKNKLLQKINPELASPELLKKVTTKLKEYIHDCFTRIKEQLKQEEVVVKAALEVASKFYKKEMNKHFTDGDWPEEDELTRLNLESTEKALSTAKAVVTINQRQENYLRDSMKTVFQQFIKELEEKEAETTIRIAKTCYSQTMKKYRSALNYIDPLALQGHHHKAVESALALASNINMYSFNEEKKQNILLILNSMFDEIALINEMKKGTYVPAIGIDLGTTFCCVAVFRNNENAEIIPSEVGRNRTPSYIAFPGYNEDEDTDEDEDEDEIICGQTAKDFAHDNQKGTIYDVKRMFGRQFHDQRLQNDMRFWPFDVIGDNGQVHVKTGPQSTQTPVQITAELLKHLKTQADKYLNAEVSKAVVTVPAYFNEQQRQETIEACALAGLTVLELVNEPTAAALAHNLHKKSKMNTPSNCLIFDFGGGTLDIAILTIIGGQIHVRAIGGDNHLGGQDIDNNLMEYCLEKFKEQHGVDLVADKNSTNQILAEKVTKRIRRLKAECEEKKQFLSTEGNEVTISVNAMHGQIDLVVKISSAVFELINQEIFKKCLEVLDAVLRKANMDKKEIHEVVMAGGSSRIPRVQKMVSDYFGGKNLTRSLDVDEAVAIGASMMAFYADNVEIPNVVFYEEETE